MISLGVDADKKGERDGLPHASCREVREQNYEAAAEPLRAFPGVERYGRAG